MPWDRRRGASRSLRRSVGRNCACDRGATWSWRRAIVGRRGSDRGLGPEYGGALARLEQPRARQSRGRSRLVAHAAVSHAVDRRRARLEDVPGVTRRPCALKVADRGQTRVRVTIAFAIASCEEGGFPGQAPAIQPFRRRRTSSRSHGRGSLRGLLHKTIQPGQSSTSDTPNVTGRLSGRSNARRAAALARQRSN